MKKIIIVMASAAFIFSSCQKASPDVIASGNSTTTNSAKAPEADLKSLPPGGGVFSAEFTYTVPDPNNIFENQTIQFNSLGSGIVSYVWTFGNGVKLYNANPAMSYIMHGFYPVTLTVTNAQGKTASSTKVILILCNFGGNHGTHDN